MSAALCSPDPDKPPPTSPPPPVPEPCELAEPRSSAPGRPSLDVHVSPAEAELTADLRAAWEKLTAEHRARVDAVLAPFVRVSLPCEPPTAAELAERDRDEAARAPKGKAPRRPGDLDLLNTLPLDALDATEDERLPAAVADLAAMQSHLAAMQSRLAGRLAEAATRKPRWRTVAWAAEQSGYSTHYFYERANPDHADPLPFLKKRGRAVRVEEAGFWRWFKSR